MYPLDVSMIRAAFLPQVHDKTQRRGGTRDSHSKRKSKGVDVSKVLAPLEGTCATIPSGYWSYIWCHRGFITQAS